MRELEGIPKRMLEGESEIIPLQSFGPDGSRAEDSGKVSFTRMKSIQCLICLKVLSGDLQTWKENWADELGIRT